MSIALKYWSHTLTAVITAVLAWQAHAWLSERQKERCDADKSAIRRDVQDAHQKAQLVTESISDAYKAQLDDIDRQLDAAKRVQPSTTVRPVGAAANAARDAGAAPDEVSGSHAVAVGPIYDLAASADKLKAELTRCQAWASAAKETVDSYNAGR